MICFDPPLIEGTLIKRYKRFLADVKLGNGDIITAHCPNTGSMQTCGEPGDLIFLSESANPNRKLRYTWEMTKKGTGCIGINTSRPNQLIAMALKQGLIKGMGFEHFDQVKTEVKYGKSSRIDILLSNAKGQLCYVEIKNTTLLLNSSVQFPDAVTERGLKHLFELADVVKSGHRAVLLFLVNRPDGEEFQPAWHIDKEYSKTLVDVARQGVEVIALRSINTPKTMEVGERVPVNLKNNSV